MPLNKETKPNQTSLANKLVLSEIGNVGFVPSKFRSDKSGMSMRSLWVIPVIKRADVLRGDVQMYFLCFVVLTVLSEVSVDQGEVERAIFLGTFLTRSPWRVSEQFCPKDCCSYTQTLLLLQPVRSDYIAWVYCVQICGYDFQCTHTCHFVAGPLPQDSK